MIAAGLFGSYARGETRGGSDIDVMVVVKNDKENERVMHILPDAQVALTENTAGRCSQSFYDSASY